MARYVKRYVTDYAYEVRETEDVENEKKKPQKNVTDYAYKVRETEDVENEKKKPQKKECNETVKNEKKKQPEQSQVSWDELANNTNLEQALNRNENRPS